MPDWQRTATLPDLGLYNILPDGAVLQALADGVLDPNTTRAMGFGSVNALKATSVVGQEPDYDSEFVVTRHSNHRDKTSDLRQSTGHRGI